MEARIVFNKELEFEIKDEHLLTELYHKIAFLAESGHRVRYIEGS